MTVLVWCMAGALALSALEVARQALVSLQERDLRWGILYLGLAVYGMAGAVAAVVLFHLDPSHAVVSSETVP